jgi:hypothetical protein
MYKHNFLSKCTISKTLNIDPWRLCSLVW